MYFFYFLTIRALRICSKCIVYKWWVGDKPTEFDKIVLKIRGENVWKQLHEVYAEASIHLIVGE